MKTVTAANNFNKGAFPSSGPPVQKNQRPQFPHSFARVIRPVNSVLQKKRAETKGTFRIGNPGLVWSLIALAIGAFSAYVMPEVLAAIWLLFTS